jgi:2-polyprenyl-3-methyl-5-hydroxy-6-metoxy-1,4-benzoquinol methylase
MKSILNKVLKHKSVAKEEWETQYENGEWRFLTNIEELGHYSIIQGYLLYYEKTKSILDVGCGEGVLQQRLSKVGYQRYFGIDLSEQAIRIARINENVTTRFMQVRAENFKTEEKYDAIIFNEILYYSEDPISLLQKYEHYLSEDGIIIISMCVHRRSTRIWKTLSSKYSFLDDTKIHNKTGNKWICKCFRLP